jgi:5-methylcytosine-specific restriction endonuclease McrA
MSDKQLHKKWRKEFREGVHERDNHTCQMCGAKDVKLDAHHITDRHDLPNGGYVLSNGISLCEPCHIKAGKPHTSGGMDFDEGFHPDELYKKIGSSEEEAIEDSWDLH